MQVNTNKDISILESNGKESPAINSFTSCDLF